MNCTVCNHPHRPAIDLALLAGGHSLASLSRQYGPGKSSLWRHKNHLQKKMAVARSRLENSRGQVSLLKLNALLDRVEHAVTAAAAEGDLDRVFKGSHIGSRIIHQISKMELPMELETVYRLISTPGFVSQDSLLPTDPNIIAGLHRALVDSAFSPCPDPSSPELADDSDNDQDDRAADVGRDSAAPPANREVPLSPDSLSPQSSVLRTVFETPPPVREVPFPPDSLETQNPELETAPPYDATAAGADELFLMAHGYPRNNPPKHIPNRRREEDFRSNSVFRDLKGTFC